MLASGLSTYANGQTVRVNTQFDNRLTNEINGNAFVVDTSSHINAVGI